MDKVPDHLPVKNTWIGTWITYATQPMRPRKLLRLYKKEKDPDVRDRMWLNILVERDGMSATKARRFYTWRRRARGAPHGAAAIWTRAPKG